MAHEKATASAMTCVDENTGETNCVGYQLPHTQEHWQAKRKADSDFPPPARYFRQKQYCNIVAGDHEDHGHDAEQHCGE